MQPRLFAISGPLTGTVKPLVDGRLSVGFDASNQPSLVESAAAQKHCTVEQVGKQFQVLDCDSRSGTFLNGVPIKRKLVQHGDTIRVGNSEFLFLLRDDESGGSSPEGAFPVRLSASATAASLRTIPVEDPAASPTFADHVGWMARDLAALFRISSIINSIRDSESLQRELLQLIFEVIPAENGAVVLLPDLDDEPRSIISSNRQGDAEDRIEIQRDLVYRAIWERSAVLSAGLPSSSGMQNVVCLPLIAVERTIGVLYLTSGSPAAPFGEDHVHFLEPVSRIAAVTLENILALDALRSENVQLKAELSSGSKMVGESRQMRHVEEFIARVAPSDSTVLIRGESGTGKEVVARAIHQNSRRPDRPFIAINCAAIPEALFESELFGYEKGAFTGAVGMRKGKLEAADNGTLFLDEIGELPKPMQAKLLRVLQQKEFERVGGNHTLPFQARVLAATNKNLEEAIKSGEFRQDLYYRLNVVSIVVPPLREHRDDIPLLALYFAAKYAEKSRRPFKGISTEARSVLMSYSWPGNVRELENAIEHAIVLGATEEILPEDLPYGMLEEQAENSGAARYHDVLLEARKELIRSSLGEAKGSVPEAARLLGLHPKYLHRLVRNLNLKSELR